jgi:hypothetical protein
LPRAAWRIELKDIKNLAIAPTKTNRVEVSMLIWSILGAVCFAGAIGGLINALLTDNGFALPQSKKLDDGVSVLRPGCLGNILVGAIAAGVSWGLYGPLATFDIIGTKEALKSNPPEEISLSLSSLAGAILVGIGGARWLTNEVDKTLLKAAASKAITAPASPEAAGLMALATPAGAWDIAERLQAPSKTPPLRTWNVRPLDPSRGSG